MVMIFAIDRVRDFLLKNGLVYTQGLLPHKTGKDWINAGIGKPKIADVRIEEIDPLMSYCRLDDYVGQSGFDSVEDSWYTYFRINEDKSYIARSVGGIS